jgi:O-antigen/teichoic acid export membrane protein
MKSATRIRSHLAALSTSPTLRATLLTAFAGVAHMLGNVLLARQLSPLEFAGVALYLAFNQVGTTLGAAGSETLVVRHQLAPSRRLLGTVTAFTCAVGAGLLLIGVVVYDMSLVLAAITFVGILASAIVRVEGAHYQSKQRISTSALLIQTLNFAVLGVAIIALLLELETALIPCLLITLCFPVAAVWAWRALTRSFGENRDRSTPYPWSEAWPIISIGAAGVLALQAERLLIPQLLSIELLATYAVLAALASAPFQILMFGVGHAMMPSFKNNESLEERRRIVRHELMLISLIAVPGGAVILLLAPTLAELLTAGKYSLSTTLVAATVLTGLGKVAYGFLAAIVRAVGTTQDLRRLNFAAWFGLAIGAVAAIPASRFGLTGLVLAVGLGWAIRSIFLLPAVLAALTRRT